MIADTDAFVIETNAWEYVREGVINSVVPNSGHGNTRVTITGIELLALGTEIVAVSLGDINATVISSSNTSVIVAAGASGIPGPGDIVLVADTGATTTVADAWTYVTPAVITSISPSSGQVGTRVTIVGTDLLLGGDFVEEVRLSGIPVAIVVSFNDTHIVCIAAPGENGTGEVEFRVNTEATAIATLAFTYLQEGTVDTVVPGAGYVGTSVSLLGTRLLGGGSQVAAVHVGTVTNASHANTRITYGNNTVIQFVYQGALDTGTYNISIVSDTGAVVSVPESWTVLQGGIISAVNPASGREGTRVYITGTNMLAGGSEARTVIINGVSATAVSTSSSVGNQTIVAIVGAFQEGLNGSSGFAFNNVTVVAENGGITTVLDVWDYVDTGSISSVSPAIGQFGTRVTITGEGLLGGGSSVDSVTLSGVATSDVMSFSDEEVVVSAPRGTPDLFAGDVVVVADTGALVLTQAAWRFRNASQSVIESVIPLRGTIGTRVSVTGGDLFGGGSAIVAATLNGVPAVVVDFSNTSVVLEAGLGQGGTGSVIVFADNGATVTAADNWTYVDAGNITTVVPALGQHYTRVTVFGVGLTADGSSIVNASLNGVPVLDILNVSNSSVVLVAGASIESFNPGDVVLSAETGGRVIAVAAWSYATPGEILSVVPSSGHTGTNVIVYGLNLRAHGGAVISALLAGVEAELVEESDFVVRVVAGVGSNSSGDVLFISDSGARITAEDRWTYITSASVATVTPNSGIFGTSVVITGSGLLMGGTHITEVTLAGVRATVQPGSSDERIVVRAGSGGPSTFAGDVIVTANTGAFATVSLGFTYLGQGDIESVVPDRGQGGTTVVIIGVLLLPMGRCFCACISLFLRLDLMFCI